MSVIFRAFLWGYKCAHGSELNHTRPVYTLQTMQEIIHFPYFLGAHIFMFFSSFAPDFRVKAK